VPETKHPNPEAPSQAGIGTATRIANREPMHSQRPSQAMVSPPPPERAFRAVWAMTLKLLHQQATAPHQQHPIPLNADHERLAQVRWSALHEHLKKWCRRKG
jgi:hypothetical protein